MTSRVDVIPRSAAGYLLAALAITMLVAIMCVSAVSGWQPGCQDSYGHDPGQHDHYAWICG